MPGHRGTARGALERSAGSVRLLIMLLCVAAFFFQSFIAQVHLHGLAHGVPGVTYVAANQQSNGASGPDGNSSCPYCQAVHQAGAYLMPTDIVIRAIVVATSGFIHVTPLLPNGAVSHDWLSRGPPVL